MSVSWQTATAETPVFTLADARKCVTRILLDLAALVAPDTYECRDCAKALESLCPDHMDDAAAQWRLEHAAGLARDAATRDDLLAAIVYATPGDAR